VFCDRCGTGLQPGMSFCPGCGKPAGIPPAPAPSSSNGRVAKHIKLLAILWMVRSALMMLPGLAIWGIFHYGFRYFPTGVPFFVRDLAQMGGVLLIAGAATGILAGWGLLERHSWARTLAIVLAVLSLLDMPFGTAIGVYTLWVLLPAESEREFRESSQGM
jgi:hypothetical protein